MKVKIMAFIIKYFLVLLHTFVMIKSAPSSGKQKKRLIPSALGLITSLILNCFLKATK